MIEKLVYGGDGLARDNGQVALLPFVLPGEQVRAHVRTVKNDLLRGRVLEIMAPAPERVKPGCPYFMRCGGCQYQHAGYAAQVEQKRAILREVLQRVGKIAVELDIETIVGEPWAYRNRAQLHIAEGRAGYFEPGSHRLCSIDHCPISSPKLNEAIGRIGSEVGSWPRFTATVELFTNETELQVHVEEKVPAAARSLFDSLGVTAPIVYDGLRVSRTSFFQVNRFLVERLVAATLEHAAGETAVDLYAGVGLFAFELTRRFPRVHAVEPGRAAFRDLEWNLKQRDSAVRAHSKTAEAFLSGLREPPDLVVADPPRAGMGKTVNEALVRLRPPAIRIVACDPATLARDLRGLLDAGYAMERIILVDLFPQTYHLETIVWLRDGRS